MGKNRGQDLYMKALNSFNGWHEWIVYGCFGLEWWGGGHVVNWPVGFVFWNRLAIGAFSRIQTEDNGL